MQIYTCLIKPVLYWRSVAVFGSVQQGNALGKLRLFCSCINATGEWKNHLRMEVMGERRKAVFFRFTQSASADRRTDFLFTRTEQVMF